MAIIPTQRPNNRLLALLPQADYDRIAPNLQPVTFEFKQTIYETESLIDYAYFPYHGTLSAVTVMDDGSMVEVATYGNEGAVGLPALMGGTVSANRVFVQVAGSGARITIEKMSEEANKRERLGDCSVAIKTSF